MGLFGSPKKPKMPPAPSLDALGKEFQDISYKSIGSALSGSGYDSYLRSANLASTLRGLRGKWSELGQSMPDTISRLVPRGDTAVRKHVMGELDRDYYRTRRDVKSQYEDMPVREREAAIGQGLDLLAGEKQMGASIANLYNQWLANEAGQPTFGSTLMSGLGGAAGWAMGYGMGGQGAPAAPAVPAQQYGKYMSDPATLSNSNNFFSRNGTSGGMQPWK